MKEMIIRVPNECVAFVEEFVEKIGDDISQIKKKTSSKNKMLKIKNQEDQSHLIFLVNGKILILNLKPIAKSYGEKLQNFSCYRHHHQNIPWRQRETQNNCSYSG
jgi:hypothetical protein